MRKSFVTVIVAALIAVAAPVLAHHASQAEFDKNSPKTISGVLTRVQWTNPHVRWYIDVKNEKTGEVETWMLQGSGPGAYKANGVSATGVFPIGKTYSAMIAPARCRLISETTYSALETRCASDDWCLFDSGLSAVSTGSSADLLVATTLDCGKPERSISLANSNPCFRRRRSTSNSLAV